MIDLHFHLLAGIDDGPETVEASVALARAASATGARVVVATPHVSPRYPNDASTIARLVSELNERLALERVALEVRTGAEIALTRIADVDDDELACLGLGGGPWLLVEPPFSPAATNVDAILLALQRNGKRMVIAHPERCPVFQRDPQMLEDLVAAGLLTSITAGSLLGRFGRVAQRSAFELARRGVIHNVASDAHDLAARAPGISDALESEGLAALATWLTQDVPAAILAGAEIPARPSLPSPRPRPARARWLRARR